jgi:UDP-glucose 4-epimerase
MTILVLGGSSRLAQSFIGRATGRHDLAIVVRRPPSIPFSGPVHLVERYDRLPPSCFQDVTAIVNCVGHADPRDGDLGSVNVEVPILAARAALESGVRRFIQLSSLSVHGEAPAIGQDTPLHPVTPYGKSKLDAEAGLSSLKAGGLEPTLLRVPILYGRGAGPKLIRLAQMMRRLGWFPAARSRPRRSVLHVDNAAAVLEHVIANGICGPVYAADREPFDLETMAAVIGSKSGREVRLVHVPDGLLTPLSAIARGLYVSLYCQSLIASQLNLSQAIEVPLTLQQGLGELLENLPA